MWYDHVSTRIASSRILNAWHLNPSDIILFTQLTHMHLFPCIILTVSSMPFFIVEILSALFSRCDLTDQFDFQSKRNNRGFAYEWYRFMVISNFATSHEQYYYKIGFHWHQAMHADSGTIICSISST